MFAGLPWTPHHLQHGDVGVWVIAGARQQVDANRVSLVLGSAACVMTGRRGNGTHDSK
jgi:hypothetical protein